MPHRVGRRVRVVCGGLAPARRVGPRGGCSAPVGHLSHDEGGALGSGDGLGQDRTGPGHSLGRYPSRPVRRCRHDGWYQLHRRGWRPGWVQVEAPVGEHRCVSAPRSRLMATAGTTTWLRAVYRPQVPDRRCGTEVSTPASRCVLRSEVWKAPNAGHNPPEPCSDAAEATAASTATVRSAIRCPRRASLTGLARVADWPPASTRSRPTNVSHAVRSDGPRSSHHPSRRELARCSEQERHFGE